MILGLNREEDRRAAIDYARKTWSYPVLLDAGPVFERYGVGPIPTTFIIDPAGDIVSRHVGYGDGMEERLEAALTALLAAPGEGQAPAR